MCKTVMLMSRWRPRPGVPVRRAFNLGMCTSSFLSVTRVALCASIPNTSTMKGLKIGTFFECAHLSHWPGHAHVSAPWPPTVYFQMCIRLAPSRSHPYFKLFRTTTIRAHGSPHTATGSSGSGVPACLLVDGFPQIQPSATMDAGSCQLLSQVSPSYTRQHHLYR